jgi:putative transposase
MPNHFHLAVWPERDDDLAAWMHWLLTTHVARYRKKYKGSGHIWQGRFKAFPIQEDEHLLLVLRYIERNPLRANLVAQAQDWRWSSLCAWLAPGVMPWLDPGPVLRGSNWLTYVNEPQTEQELIRLRHSVHRGTPFGGDAWTATTAAQLGLESTVRPRGRPRIEAAEEEDPLASLFRNK